MNHLPLFEDPSVIEMTSRKNKLLALMNQAKLDSYVITDPDNIYWLTHFANYVHERPFILILSSSGELTFIVPKLEVVHVQSRVVGNISMVTYQEFPYLSSGSWEFCFKHKMKEYSKVGIDSVAPCYIFHSIEGHVEALSLIEQARYIKSDYEISRVVYSSNIAVKAMNKLLKMAKPGLSALTVHGKLTKLMRLQLLADNPEMNVLATDVAAVVQPPSLSHDPHNFTNVMAMDMESGGPHVSIINGKMNGYGTEVERTFFLGKPPEKAVRPYQVMMEARAICFEMCRPGVDMHDVDTEVIKLFKKYGYSDNVLHRAGHSIGVTGHEGPFLAKGFHHEIKPNMLFTIEPGIYIQGVGGFRHSDTVLVTNKGCQSLTNIKDSLSEMTLPSRNPIFSLSLKKKQALLNMVNRYMGLNA